jgi:hypothetical protein
MNFFMKPLNANSPRQVKSQQQYSAKCFGYGFFMNHHKTGLEVREKKIESKACFDLRKSFRHVLHEPFSAMFAWASQVKELEFECPII